MLDIKIKPIHDNFKYPIRGSKYAACWDVYAADIKQLDADKFEIDLGFATEIPKGYKGVIVPRSSITKTDLVMQNSPAQIDCDFRGSWKVKFTLLPYGVDIEKDPEFIDLIPDTLSFRDFPYQAGDRVAQVYFEKVEPFEWDLVSILSDTDRGSGGFGSTGK